MLISQTPVRLSMGGGGTDVAAYYEQYGGSWTSAAISQYVYSTVNSRNDNNYLVKYSNITEYASHFNEIQHNIIRETLKYMKFDEWQHPLFRTRGLEINIISDVQGQSGLGVSGALTVGLLHILHQLKGERLSCTEVSEKACFIERSLAGSTSTGKQDQYIASYGGITSFDISVEGKVVVSPLVLDRHTISELQDNIVLFGTRIKRIGTADQTLKKVAEKLQSHASDDRTAEYLHAIKKIGIQQRDALLQHKPDDFGALLDEHWEVKKKYSDHSDEAIDRAYASAKKVGALGGKVIGASSKGAYMMFYCTNGKEKLRPIMGELDMIEIPWTFEFTGSRIIHIH